MPEYIDRAKTIGEFKTCGAVFTYGVDVCNGIISRLLIQPAADVAPVVHGKWVICSDGYYPYCSNCRNEPKGGLSNYCPNCGAKMQNEE